MNMSSNFQGRRRGKSVSFRGQSNDSNFYDHKPRNMNRDYQNFENSEHDLESRVVKLLPDANMTISVANDFRGSNRGRSRGSRGILKSHSFRDDTHLDSRSSEFMDEYSPPANRGFETYSGHAGYNRGRARTRGFYYRSQLPPRFPDGEYEDREREREREFSYSNEGNFRGRSKSTSDRSRRGRGGRGRSRGRSTNRISDDHCEGPTAADGDNENSREIPDNQEDDNEKPQNGFDSIESPLISENLPPSSNETEKESSGANIEQSESADSPTADPPASTEESGIKLEPSKETEENSEERETKVDSTESM